MSQTISFVPLLTRTQQYISEHYAASLSDENKYAQLRSYIEKFLYDNGYIVEGMTFREIADKLYTEMAEYSVLTQYLGRDDIEEINVNGWDDLAITYVDGRIEKAAETAAESRYDGIVADANAEIADAESEQDARRTGRAERFEGRGVGGAVLAVDLHLVDVEAV